MKQAIKKKSFSAASLRQPRSARTVLLRMAADQERADRIRALKQARPDLTWRRIGDYVGVSERAAINWQKDGGMDYDNAKKLAELLEVDVDYIWRGTETSTPDLLDGTLASDGSVQEQLAEIRQQLADAQSERERIEAAIKTQNENLAAQTAILGRIEAATKRNDDSTQRLGEAAAEVIRLMREAESAAQSRAEAQSGTGGSDSSTASS